tara:strand:- start:804 stop:1136 length:333 start_codon:yes stop_codon:yes gene_type:complete
LKNKLFSFLAPFYLFAGLPFAWYCFMPNFGVLSEKKIYRSQLTIHLDNLVNRSKYLWKRTTLPKDIEWKACRYDAFDEFQIKLFETSSDQKDNQNRLFKYMDNQCGEKPS